MNQKLSYYLNVLLAIGLFLIVFKYGCNPEYKDKPIVINEVADSNAIYDHIDSEYSGKMIILYDSIDNLNKRLKTSKTKFNESFSKFKSIPKTVLKIDSLGDIIYKDKRYIATEEIDSNCLITLYYANTTILQQDSIIGLQDRSIDACNSQVVNLRNQVVLNKSYASKLLEANILVTNENEKLKKKVKRNRGIAIIVTAILGSLILIK